METRTVKQTPANLAKALSMLPASYVALLADFPLRPIRTTTEYECASKLIHRLALREGQLEPGEEAYLEVLEGIVERYDRQNSSLDIERTTPTQLLNMLVKQANMTVSELGKLIGSKGAASELLSGKRPEASKAQIAKLSARFKVNASAFLLRSILPANAA